MSSIGHLIRHWRERRRLSQEELAAQADISPRHMSFVETGRSRPSRDLVIRLAAALEIPLREQNTLLAAAGYSKVFSEGMLGIDMVQVARALDFLLDRLEPYPTFVVDRMYNILRMNRGMERFVAYFLGREARERIGSPNLLRMAMSRNLMRPYIANWDEAFKILLYRLRREAWERHTDDALNTLVAEVIESCEAEGQHVLDLETDVPVMAPVRFRKGDQDVALMTMETTFGSSENIELQELRVELAFPADEESDRFLKRLEKAAQDRGPCE